MWRAVLATITGFLTGFVVIFSAMVISSAIYPLPAGLNPQNPEAMKTYIQTLPAGAFVVVLTGHFLGTMSAGFVSSLIYGRVWNLGAMILGTLFLFAGISNLLAIPHPNWFAVVDLLLYLPAALIGAKTVGLLLHGKSEDQES